MPARCRHLALGLLSVLGGDAALSDSPYADLGEPLAKGKAIWLANCEGCHGHGVADAPIPMVPEQWRPRLEKDMTVLYGHAINGFFGPDYSMMPARGGNEELSDAEVRSAVDYMTGLARYHINMTRKEK